MPVSDVMGVQSEANGPRAQPIFRFAPSPNGPLHRGHALSALLNAALARRIRGRFLLRIEDIDPQRSRLEHIDAVFDAMAWLGIRFGVPRRQSRHMEDYAAAFEQLKSLKLVYPCVCSRSDLHAHSDLDHVDPDGAPLYPGTCRPLNDKDRMIVMTGTGDVLWRLDMARAVGLAGPLTWSSFNPLTGTVQVQKADPARWGDVVLRRKDTPTSYHLSVVVDDALQGVTHVVRGVDLEAATDIHCLLQKLLGLPSPLYWHHPLILGPDGRKLAKSKGSASLALERAHGLTRAALIEDFKDAGFGTLLADPEKGQPEAG